MLQTITSVQPLPEPFVTINRPNLFTAHA